MIIIPEKPSKSSPQNWAEDELSKFLESGYRNQFATFDNKRRPYIPLKIIDSCFHKMGNEGFTNTKSPLEALLFCRSHSAFRASVGLTLSTQLSESFVLMRSVLEYAAYALHIIKILVMMKFG
jgi:hypothetical protein